MERGRIDIGEDGEPTGILRDAAAALIYNAMPAPTQDERIEALSAAIARANGLARLRGRLAIRPLMRKTLTGSLAGLKHHVETGEVIGEDTELPAVVTAA